MNKMSIKQIEESSHEHKEIVLCFMKAFTACFRNDQEFRISGNLDAKNLEIVIYRDNKFAVEEVPVDQLKIFFITRGVSGLPMSVAHYLIQRWSLLFLVER